MTKADESGESVMHVGVDLDFLNSYRSVWDLNDQSPGRFLGEVKGS